MSAPPVEARRAGLRWVTDEGPGLSRQRRGRGFSYLDTRGRPIRRAETLARIRAIAIPPAWTDVWICPDPDGHIQATGRDQRGRKQYRYHPAWRAARDESKFGHLAAFGRALPRIRRRVERDLALPDLPRDRVIAAVVRLLDVTALRVGNEEYARQNDSYGLTTLQNTHVTVRGERVTFEFTAKSGKPRCLEVCDATLAAIVQACRRAGDGALFEYVDDEGHAHAIASDDVNAYLRAAAQTYVTAKDFRTWAGTARALQALRRAPAAAGVTARKRQLNEALKEVAEYLGNTVAVARASYVHPAVPAAHLAGESLERDAPAVRRLSANERTLLAILEGPDRRSRVSGRDHRDPGTHRAARARRVAGGAPTS